MAVGNKSGSYPGQDSEHRFGGDDVRNLGKEIREIIRKSGAEEGSLIVADYIQRFTEREEKEKRELEECLEKERQEKRIKGKRKSTLKITVGFFVFGIALTYVFERLGNRGTLWEFLGAILIDGSFIIEIMLAAFNLPKFFRTREEGEGIGEGMVKCLKGAWQQLKNESGMQLLIIAMVVAVLANCFAWVKPFECARAFCTGGYVALAGCAENNNNSITDAPPADGEALADAVISYEMKQYLTGSDETLIRQLDRARVTQTQKNMVLNLSAEDYCRIFFYGETGMEGYETQEQLNAKVQAMVEELRGERLDNVFDKDQSQGGASQPLQDAINQLNDTENERNSFSEVEERLNLRENTNVTYPKRTLTQLVANDYDKLARLLVWYGGEQSTIIYHYGQSILYNFDCLKYAENTDRLIKEKLGDIAQRYDDLAYVCPDFKEAGRARSLSAAFRYVADQY